MKCSIKSYFKVHFRGTLSKKTEDRISKLEDNIQDNIQAESQKEKEW